MKELVRRPGKKAGVRPVYLRFNSGGSTLFFADLRRSKGTPIHADLDPVCIYAIRVHSI